MRKILVLLVLAFGIQGAFSLVFAKDEFEPYLGCLSESWLLTSHVPLGGITATKDDHKILTLAADDPAWHGSKSAAPKGYYVFTSNGASFVKVENGQVNPVIQVQDGSNEPSNVLIVPQFNEEARSFGYYPVSLADETRNMNDLEQAKKDVLNGDLDALFCDTKENCDQKMTEEQKKFVVSNFETSIEKMKKEVEKINGAIKGKTVSKVYAQDVDVNEKTLLRKEVKSVVQKMSDFYNKVSGVVEKESLENIKKSQLDALNACKEGISKIQNTSDADSKANADLLHAISEEITQINAASTESTKPAAPKASDPAVKTN